MKKGFSFLKMAIMIVVFSLVIYVPASYAESVSDLKSQKEKVDSKTEQLSDQIQTKKSEINTIENRQDKIMDQINVLAAKIETTNKEIVALNEKIDEANKKIDQLNNEIDELQKKIEERAALLEERARAIQVNGSISYLDVLLGANSFVDFIDRVSAVTTLLDADRQIMRDQKSDQQQLQDQKQQLEDEKKKLVANQEKLNALKASLDSQSKEKNKLVDELEAEQASLAKEKRLLESEYSEAIKVSEKLEAQIATAQRKAAAAAAAAAKKAAQSSASTPTNVDSSNLPAVSAGTWTKPTNGRFTSKFGWRNIGYGQEFHYGIDLAGPTGTPIVAAAAGVVTYASPMSTYGNVIFITHNVNGQIFTTVYAHLSGFWVSNGAVVEKGQKIAPMGNTGRSFGSHLHFELHVGEWNGKRSNAVNPLRYISL